MLEVLLVVHTMVVVLVVYMFVLRELEPLVLVLVLGPCIQEACMLEAFVAWAHYTLASAVEVLLVLEEPYKFVFSEGCSCFSVVDVALASLEHYMMVLLAVAFACSKLAWGMA